MSWIRRTGARELNKPISQPCCDKVLNGRPLYHRLPSHAQLYQKKESIWEGNILVGKNLPDKHFDRSIARKYNLDTDWVEGSYYGPGSGAVLYRGRPARIGDPFNLEVRSAYLGFNESRIRDDSGIPKAELLVDGSNLILSPNESIYLWWDAEGRIAATRDLPTEFNPEVGYLWCDDNASIYNTLKVCKDIRKFPSSICEENPLDFVQGYKIITNEEVITSIIDYRQIREETDPPIAKWLTEFADNELQSMREWIEVFPDDYLNPWTAGHFLIPCEAEVRADQRFEEILKFWDAGVWYDGVGDTFNLSITAELELKNYDRICNRILDWLAQHVGFNGIYWIRGSFNLNPNKFKFTILEKRAIIANSLVSLNKKHPFDAFPWDHAFRGLHPSRGTPDGIHFLFDTFQCHGYSERDNPYQKYLWDFYTPLRLIPQPAARVDYIKIGETPLVSYNQLGYSHLKYPQYWERTDKKYLNAQWSKRWAGEDSLISGFWNFEVGKSQIGEAIWGEPKGDSTTREITLNVSSPWTITLGPSGDVITSGSLVSYHREKVNLSQDTLELRGTSSGVYLIHEYTDVVNSIILKINV